MGDDDRTVIRVDSRGRISLGALATRDLYLASVHHDGTILLEPAVVVPLKRDD